MSEREWPDVDPGAAGLHAEWYAANAQAGRLTIQRCGECRQWRHPSRYRCAECHGAVRSFEVIDPAGRVVNHTVTHRPLHPSFAAVVPYAIAVVELDEGPRMLVVVRSDHPDALLPGARVEIEVSERGVPHALLTGSSVRE